MKNPSDSNREISIFQFDEIIRKQFPIICGIDEAGRGPLAGEVFAAAVVLTKEIVGLDDSKKLTGKKRDLLYDQIIAKADYYHIATATVEEINNLNILNATMLAMERAYLGLGIQPDIALVDGNRLPEGIDCQKECIVKGDASSGSIAAASILAKVSRDRYMEEMAEKYPQYQFEKHKGYGTKLHAQLLLEHGPSPIHRPLFIRKILGGENG